MVSDAQFKAVLATTPATPAQIGELMRINQATRISALRSSFLLLALICLVAIFPAMRLPRYRLVDFDAEEIVDEQRQAAHRAAPVAG